jgi:hypothetical protein
VWNVPIAKFKTCGIDLENISSRNWGNGEKTFEERRSPMVW